MKYFENGVNKNNETHEYWLGWFCKRWLHLCEGCVHRFKVNGDLRNMVVVNQNWSMEKFSRCMSWCYLSTGYLFFPIG